MLLYSAGGQVLANPVVEILPDPLLFPSADLQDLFLEPFAFRDVAHDGRKKGLASELPGQ